MCKYIMGGFETNWPSVNYHELEAYHPIARTYLIGWKNDNPLESHALTALLWAGNDRGFYQCRPQAVGSGEFPLFLVDVAEFSWLKHLEDMIRILCDTKYCCYSPFERASSQWKADSKEFDETLKSSIFFSLNKNGLWGKMHERGLA